MTPQDITKLIVRTSMKDRAAFDLLYRQTSAKLFGVCLRVLSDRAEAEEALQEVYVKIWTKADRFAVSELSPIRGTGQGPGGGRPGRLPQGRELCRTGGTPRRAAEHDANLAAPQPDETERVPGAMSLAEDSGPERGGDDILAAEYVLGVLPAEERQAAAARIDAEPAFSRLVDRWEVDFSPMQAAYQPVEPPASVKVAIDRRLFSSTAQATVEKASLWSSLAFWRGLAAAAVAAFALYVAVPLINPPAQQPQAQLIASLAADGSDVHYLVIYDPAKGEVGLSHVSGDRASGKDFELWMIEGNNPPVSMGVIPAEAGRLAVSEANRAKLAAGSVLAVSLEPTGGSPTGQPTGPVVAAGPLSAI
jgi:anti-sigma-K factor RskA